MWTDPLMISIDDNVEPPKEIEIKSYFLSDIIESSSYCGWDQLGKNKMDISINGSYPSKSLWMHPPCNGFGYATYTIDEDPIFSGGVAFTDSAQPKEPCLFSIYSNGKAIWEKRIDKKCDIQNFSLCVPAGKLQLRACCNRDNSWMHCVWIYPNIEPR